MEPHGIPWNSMGLSHTGIYLNFCGLCESGPWPIASSTKMALNMLHVDALTVSKMLENSKTYIELHVVPRLNL